MISKYCFSLSLFATCCCVQAEFPTLKELNEYLESKKIDHQKEPSGILNIQYNSQGEPVTIETKNIHLWELLHDFGKATGMYERNFPEEIGKISETQLKTNKHGEIFKKLSQSLSHQTLKDRGISDDEINNLINKCEVREITFESLVDGFFPEKAKELKEYLKDENQDQLVKYIDDWVENLLPLKQFQCKNEIKYFNTIKSQNNISNEFNSTNNIDVDILYQPTDLLEVKKFHQELKDLCHNCIKYKNGKEKIILMIAFDQLTTEKNRLLIKIKDKDYENSYDINCNVIETSNRINVFLHEIGHYLECAFRLDKNEPIQNIDDFYQIPFTKFLFSLKEPEQEGKVTIPTYIYATYLENLNWNTETHKNVMQEYSLRNLYFNMQIFLNWFSISEVTNIIGLYILRDNQQTPYIGINRLSDINCREYITFGQKSYTKENIIKDISDEFFNDGICKDFKECEKKNCIDNLKQIAEKCEIKNPSEASMKLLLKLHERVYDPGKILYLNQITDGTITLDEAWQKLEPLLPRK